MLDNGAEQSIKFSTKGSFIETWKVKSCRGCGKVHEQTHELKRYRWKSGEKSTDSGHKISFIGYDSI
ncbi:hypothetical protein DPMN_177642 [Dreissena polymorpha]|uniref:Uncharacterized protein n=1 Tax=Dreissena polymorpha TaxID=45954 RepID=A0A9D4EDN6_DREPO|nr:hypothetical protein DPMN_177642 [Dreissena polymorpha]